MKLLKTDSIVTVREKLNQHFQHIKAETELVDILQCVHRYLAEDIYADIDNPSFSKSVVDGYGVLGSDTFGVSDSAPVFLKIIGSVEMGKMTQLTLKKGECVYVPTGGMMPQGADCVCMVEYTEALDEDTICINKPCAPRSGVILQGDDFHVGDFIFPTGKRIKAKDVGMLAATGHEKIKVFVKPQITIISTGDEIVAVGEVPSMGEVRDINSYALAAMAEELGCQVKSIEVIRDDYDLFQESLKKAVANSDVILISGGSSAGMKDITVDVMQKLENAEVFTHGIAIKPGKPTIIGSVGTKPVFGLPGHPVAAISVFKSVVEDFIYQFYFHSVGEKQTIQARISCNIHNGEGRETYQYVTLKKDENGYVAVPIFSKSSAIKQVMMADGYIVIDSLLEGILENQIVDVILC